MKVKFFIQFLFVTLLGLTQQTHAQNCFAHVDLSRRSVYVQQSFRVTITVYTSTWFTAPLEFGHLQIPNAFIIPFERTIPGVFHVNGKQYAGVQFYYIVFPYKAGDFSIPPVEITAHTPPEGSSTAQSIVLHTEVQKFTVRDVPDKMKEYGDWFVAKDVSLQQHWSKPLKDIKAGDVVKRTVTVNAKGTLPQFIPDLSAQEKVDWASTYPQEAALKDTRDEADANGSRTQTVTYLFEKEGDFVMPAIRIAWWNPFTNQTHVKTIDTVRIHVAANPNLGILKTLKDSLQATQQIDAQKTAQKGPVLILGMRWYTFAGVLLAALLLVYILTRLTMRLIRYLKRNYQAYRVGENYLFHRFLHSSNNAKSFLNSLYAWWDSLLRKKSASVTNALKSDRQDELANELQQFYAMAYNDSNTGVDSKAIKKSLKKYRKQKKQRDSVPHTPGIADVQKEW